MKRRAFGLESTAGAIRTLAVDFSHFVRSLGGIEDESSEIQPSMPDHQKWDRDF